MYSTFAHVFSSVRRWLCWPCNLSEAPPPRVLLRRKPPWQSDSRTRPPATKIIVLRCCPGQRRHVDGHCLPDGLVHSRNLFTTGAEAGLWRYSDRHHLHRLSLKCNKLSNTPRTRPFARRHRKDVAAKRRPRSLPKARHRIARGKWTRRKALSRRRARTCEASLRGASNS